MRVIYGSLVVTIAVVLLLGGVYAGWHLRPTPDLPPVVRTLPPRVVVKERPVPVEKWNTKLVWRTVPVSAEGVADTAAVAERDSFVAASEDSLIPPRFLEYSFRYDGQRLLQSGILSNGDLVTSVRDDVKPTFEGGWTADSTWVREERLARFPTWQVAGGAVVVTGVVLCVVLC